MKVYYADIRFLKTDEQIHKAMEYLSEQRMEKAEHCRKEEDRIRSLAAGLLLEYGLREYGLSQRKLQFSYGPDGKPEISGVPDLHFNLTHAKDYVAAVFSDRENGIDLERIRTKTERIAERFFTEEEKNMLKENWSDDLFTRIWTRKESFLKTTGQGIRRPLDSFSVLEDELEENREHYFFKSYDGLSGYWLSVCQKGQAVDAVPQEVDLAAFLR